MEGGFVYIACYHIVLHRIVRYMVGDDVFVAGGAGTLHHSGGEG